MKSLALACARVGLCVCCCVGTVRGASAAEQAEPAAISDGPMTVVQVPVPEEPASEHASLLRVPRAVGGVAAGFMSHLDHQTFKPGTWDNSFFEVAGRELGSPVTLVGGTAMFAAQGLATGDHEQVETAGLMGLGFVGTSATVQGLKHFTGRTRPDGSDDSSFPSGHTANSFLAAAVLAKEYGGATAIVSYGAATFVGASRIAGGRHHFTDVLVGAAIGQLFGLLVNSIDH
ncbi:MAG TPA: phosphatase PAP2 family protein [Thermoanaerobaculia bacterium]|nr:phosphatase PAP2 family protein [Thermoanaerobaculia bacterium]